MRKAILAFALSAVLPLICGAALGGEGAYQGKGRIVTVGIATGGAAALYLPSGHEPARAWPLVVYLPGRAEAVEDSLAPWLKAADACGIVLAVPATARPDPARGFDDLTVLGTVRAALANANCDPERTALVGFGPGGLGASAVAVTYPRLVRAVAIVGTLPVQLRAGATPADRLPARLVLLGEARNLEQAREWKKARPDEAIEIAELRDSERGFSDASAKAVIGWLAGRFEFGGLKAPERPAPRPDAGLCAAELAEAATLVKTGAQAGAYVRMLRAGRADPGSEAARLALARACLESGRIDESLEWAREAGRIAPKDAAPHLAAGAALLRLGRAGDALAELGQGGDAGAGMAAAVERRRAEFAAAGSEAARAQFRKAVEGLASGDFAEAARQARAAVKSAPWEAACRALAVHAVLNAEGLKAARRELDDYLAMMPDDVRIANLAAALDATDRTDYLREGRPPEARVALGRLLPVGPGAAMLAALAAKAGLGAEEEKLAQDLAGAGANLDPRAGLPLLAGRGLLLNAGRGSLADLRDKLAGGVPVLVRMPPGELAGLGENERYNAGLPRMVVGYDDRAKRLLLRDYGAGKPMAVPYELFDRLWGCLDRWWLTVTADGKPPAGLGGDLTALELAAGKTLGNDFAGALDILDGPEGKRSEARRRQLARGMVLWRLGRLEEARAELAGLADGPTEFALQANLAIGAIDEQSGGPMPGRLDKSLESYRRAWRCDPGSELATVSLSMALVKRGRAEDLAEARGLLEDYLRIQPGSLSALLLRYSF